MAWPEQLSKAVDYVEDHLDQEISLETAAKIACCSTYQFQRMFSYIVGVPLSEYIRRRRMTAAAFDLQSTKMRVIDVALNYGYGSPTAFNRAFHSVHGVSPIKARAAGTKLQAFPRVRFALTVSGGESLRFRMENTGPLRVVGIRTSLSTDLEQNFKTVPPFWKQAGQHRTSEKIAALNNRKPYGLLGVTMYHSPGDFSYYIGSSTDLPAPKGMYACEIPASTWAVFTCEAPFPQSIQETYRRFYLEWLPVSGYEYTETADMEVYPVEKGGACELWLSVRKG